MQIQCDLITWVKSLRNKGLRACRVWESKKKNVKISRLFRISDPLLWGQIRLRQNETISFTVTCVTFDHTKIDDDLSTVVEKDVCKVTQDSPKKANSSVNWYFSRQIYPIKMGLLLKNNCIKQNLVCSLLFKYLIVFGTSICEKAN